MRKYILPLVLILTLHCQLFSQNLSFDQTVEYLQNFTSTSANLAIKNEIYCGCYKSHHEYSDSVSVNKNGRVAYSYKQYKKSNASFNVFDIARGAWEFGYCHENTKKENVKCEYSPHLNLYDSNGKFLIMFCGLTNADGNRLYKALLHLKTVCSKDPFAN